MKTKSARRRSRKTSGWRPLKRNGWSSERLLEYIRWLLRRDGYMLSPRQRRVHAAMTRDALARAKASGVKLGRPSRISDEIRDRILRERETKTLRAIADGLNADQIATAQGGSWHASTVRFILDREAGMNA